MTRLGQKTKDSKHAAQKFGNMAIAHASDFCHEYNPLEEFC